MIATKMVILITTTWKIKFNVIYDKHCQCHHNSMMISIIISIIIIIIIIIIIVIVGGILQ